MLRRGLLLYFIKKNWSFSQGKIIRKRSNCAHRSNRAHLRHLDPINLQIEGHLGLHSNVNIFQISSDVGRSRLHEYDFQKHQPQPLRNHFSDVSCCVFFFNISISKSTSVGSHYLYNCCCWSNINGAVCADDDMY